MKVGIHGDGLPRNHDRWTSCGTHHRDPLIAARQQATREWCRDEASKYNVFISQLVLDECSDGDPEAAAERLEVVKDLDLIDASDEVDALAKALIDGLAVPASEPRDAFHIPISAVNGINYLLKWNFKHIANASLRGRIEQVSDRFLTRPDPFLLSGSNCLRGSFRRPRSTGHAESLRRGRVVRRSTMRVHRAAGRS